MNCTNPITLHSHTSPRFPRGLVVPCGKCLQCKIQKRKEWSIRMLHENDSWDRSCFLTLTYQDKYLPYQPIGPYGPVPYPWPTLQKSDIQKFFKRLRRDLANENRHIKYFACGEYGDDNQRPHYHAIVYGLGLSADDRNYVMENWPFCDWKVKAIRENSFGLVEPDSIQYVAGYINKKYNNQVEYEEYHKYAREPTFRILSQGLGKEYIYKNAEQLYQNGFLTHKSVPQSIPRYYLDKLDEMGLRPDVTNNQAIKEIEVNEKALGLSYTDREIFAMRRPDIEDTKLQVAVKAKKQHEQNLKQKNAQFKRDLK